ncbi:MAG: Vms1/Ankzf1 family peptidyl-tRNA hydrolase [Dehalococcoidia bacterium]
MTSVPVATGPHLTHRSDLLERLIDFEIESGAEFVVELLPAGYSLGEEWESLPKSAHDSENGIILISALVAPSDLRPRLALLPPFPITEASDSNSFDDLRTFIGAHRTIGIILLRLGHWAVAIAEDGKLAVTKTGSRYVKNQHRKGGQSSNRFRRGREKWIRELFDQAGEVASARFRDYPGQIDYLALGGDRVVLGRFLKRVKLPEDLGERALPNRISVDQPGRKALDSAVRDAWSYRAYELVNEV